ncbi:hypothetical protein OSTOST_11918, partial [Ostertagia ostertagi]
MIIGMVRNVSWPYCSPLRPLSAILRRDIATSSRLDKNQAGKYRATVDRSRLLTYEMAQKPHHIGVRKSWLSWHSHNLEEFKQSQPLMVVHDEVIRRFVRGFFPQNVVISGEEVSFHYTLIECMNLAAV